MDLTFAIEVKVSRRPPVGPGADAAGLLLW
jgi:hypothetical protein